MNGQLSTRTYTMLTELATGAQSLRQAIWFNQLTLGALIRRGLLEFTGGKLRITPAGRGLLEGFGHAEVRRKRVTDWGQRAAEALRTRRKVGGGR